MLYLTIITTNPLPNGAFQRLGNQWKKQLSSFVKLDYRFIKSADGIKKATQKQKDRGDLIVVLDASGATFTSEAFASQVQRWQRAGQHVTVVLGDAKGLSDNIKQSANLLLSLSPMTTTHDLAHLFFLEQLYRAMTIISGKAYHY